MPHLISVIIPTLNEVESLGPTISAIKELRGNIEIIVVDGGSTDGTVDLAKASGAGTLIGLCGRGTQMRAGAAVARGDVLWFLHADTIPDSTAIDVIEAALRDAAVAGGNFRIEFDGDTRPARFMSWLYPKLRRIGLVYGDSAIFVRRAAYEKIGGFNPLPLFEDLDLVRRLRDEGKFVHLSAIVVTSSRRFAGRSFLLMFARWSILQVLFWFGVNPNFLATLYRPNGSRYD